MEYTSDKAYSEWEVNTVIHKWADWKPLFITPVIYLAPNQDGELVIPVKEFIIVFERKFKKLSWFSIKLHQLKQKFSK